MFRAGDKVRCVSIRQHIYRECPCIGTIYEIIAPTISSEWIYMRSLDITNPQDNSFLEEDFVLVESKFGFKNNCGRFKDSYV